MFKRVAQVRASVGIKPLTHAQEINQTLAYNRVYVMLVTYTPARTDIPVFVCRHCGCGDLSGATVRIRYGLILIAFTNTQQITHSPSGANWRR